MKYPLVMVCRGCLGAWYLDRSLLEPGAVLYHGCGGRARVGADRGLIWF
ncbi:MAG TPA: hypothetical protein VGX70_04990 [Gemmataceae bacterium]|nr:hypothetical protein [Gemmataceae bacterium]